MFSVEDRDRARDHVLGLAEAHGRRVDDLPRDVRAPFADTLVRSLERPSCGARLAGQLRRCSGELAARVEAQLLELVGSSGNQPSR